MKYKKRITKDEISRILLIKKEFKLILLKSVFKNHQLLNKNRLYAYYLLQKNNPFLCRQKNFCLLTGKGRGVYSITNSSRQSINKSSKLGFLINYKNNNIK